MFQGSVRFIIAFWLMEGLLNSHELLWELGVKKGVCNFF